MRSLLSAPDGGSWRIPTDEEYETLRAIVPVDLLQWFFLRHASCAMAQSRAIEIVPPTYCADGHVGFPITCHVCGVTERVNFNATAATPDAWWLSLWAELISRHVDRFLTDTSACRRCLREFASALEVSVLVDERLAASELTH